MGNAAELLRWKRIRTWFLGTLLVGAGVGFVVLTLSWLCLCDDGGDDVQIPAQSPQPVMRAPQSDFDAEQGCEGAPPAR